MAWLPAAIGSASKALYFWSSVLDRSHGVQRVGQHIGIWLLDNRHPTFCRGDPNPRLGTEPCLLNASRNRLDGDAPNRSRKIPLPTLPRAQEIDE
jgi:hypothetical protein